MSNLKWNVRDIIVLLTFLAHLYFENAVHNVHKIPERYLRIFSIFLCYDTENKAGVYCTQKLVKNRSNMIG